VANDPDRRASFSRCDMIPQQRRAHAAAVEKVCCWTSSRLRSISSRAAYPKRAVYFSALRRRPGTPCTSAGHRSAYRMDAADGFAGPAEPELADGAVLWMEWQRREREGEREREREKLNA